MFWFYAWVGNCFKPYKDFKMTKTQQTPLKKKHLTKGEKKGKKGKERKERLEFEPKEQIPQMNKKGQKNKSCSRTPTNCKKQIIKRRMAILKSQVVNLEEPSLAMISCFKIEPPYTFL